MSKTQRELRAGVQPYAERVIENLRWLMSVNEYSVRRTAGIADVSHSSLRFILEGTNLPGLGALIALATALGVEPGDLLLEPTALQAKVEEAGLRPLPNSRPSVISNRPSSQPSKVAGARRAANGRMSRSTLRELLKNAAEQPQRPA